MLPPILDCGIFEVTWEDKGNNRVYAMCLECRRQYRVKLNQTGSVHNHVKKHHPHMKKKIEDRKAEQKAIRKELRLEKERIYGKIKRNLDTETKKKQLEEQEE